MKTIFLTMAVCFLNFASATNYYFSSISGDDSRTSTQAKSSSTPWKTLSKLNSFFTSLQPGDSVLLKRGETFYGSIILKKSGTSALPIVIAAYGAGNRPVITSLATLTNWVSKGNGIWESYNSSLGSTVNMVLLNGVEQQMGRYPNSDASYNGYLIFETHVGKTSITDNELTSAINWTGGELVIRTRRWIMDRNLITAHSGGTISYKTTDIYDPYDKYGYFIQNHIKTLDKLGEWYYNPSTKKLNVYFGSNSPSSYNIQVTTKGSLVSSLNYSNILFDNLTIKGSNDSSFTIRSGSNIAIQNCDILFSGKDGVAVNSHTNFKLENCTIANSNNNGIKFGFGVNYSTVKNNKILNTALIKGMGVNGDGQGIAIYNNGDGNTIEYNEIRNTGFIGISFKGNSVNVKNNLIDSFCLTKDDGSGIYSNTAFISYSGSKVTGNIVMNGIGAVPGTGPSIYSTSGIYMDNCNSKVEITGNTLVNCHDYGIYLHNASAMIVKNNTFYNNNIRQLTMIQDADHPSSIRNNVLTQNIFFAKLQTQLTSFIESSADDIAYFGKFDSNYYARPLDDRITIFNHYPGVTSNFDLDGWKQEYGKDPASKRTAKQIEAYKVNSLIGANKVTNGTFTSNITGAGASSCTLSWSTSGLLDGGYLQVTPTATKSYASMKIGGLTAGKKYILKYSVRGSVDNMSVTTYLRQGLSPYTALAAKQTRKVSIARSENELLFIPIVNESAGSVVFQADQQSKYYLDNIQVFEADAIITNPDDSIKFVYNVTKVNKSVSLNGNYMDAKGSKFSSSITLLPFTSAILIKTGGTVNTPPIVTITSPVTNARFVAPGSITINATASDPGGSVTKVAFYNGSTLLGSDNTSPYSFTWNSVPAGNYSLTAKATDNGSLVTTSSSISVSVSPSNGAPAVSITSPVVNAKFMVPANITISATATDANGSITKVDFYNGGTFLGSDNTSPYSFTWNSVPAGNFSLTAKATDNSGLTTYSSAISVSVSNSNGAPTVSIASPVTNTKFNAPASITISATAADADGKISKVEFYNGTTLLHTESDIPYDWTWQNVPAGNYILTAKAIDNNSLKTTSAAVSVSVSNPNGTPAVSITNPVSNSKFVAPASITISATASDVDGSVSKVDFYNGNTLLGSDNTSPYSFTWNNVSAGNYSLTAKVTDNGSTVVSSTAVTVSVSNPNAAPTVSITSPVTNAKFNAPASITISAGAADADGLISKVDFYNGNTLLGSDNTSPYSFVWNNIAAGNYSLTAKATDNGSLVTTSSAISVSVSNPNVAPTVSITTPATNVIFEAPASITINAAATDADGIVTKVSFYNGTTFLGSDNTSPYSFTWSNVVAGNYSLTAKATDNGALVTSSMAVTASVINPGAPIVIITSPVADARFAAPANITINCTATVDHGTIKTVEFYNGATLLNTINKTPYTYGWKNVPAGNYKLTAKATDNNGLTTTSVSVPISVETSTLAKSSTFSTTAASNVPVENTILPPNSSTTVSKLNILSDYISLKVVPNPASKTLYILTNGLHYKDKFLINIFSVSGTLIRTIQPSFKNQIIQVDISPFSSGIYVVKATSGARVLCKQFVKL